MVYCSTNIALAILETLIHIRFAGLPLNRFLVRIDIPDQVWRKRELLSLPCGWDAVPPGKAGRNAGDAWARSKRSPLLVVPSVIVPDEHNILINPLHPATRSISATTLKKWIYDPRFF